MRKREPELEKIAMMPNDTLFDVTLTQKMKFTKDEYLLYGIAKRAYEEQNATPGIPAMPFEEYVLRAFIVGIGAKIATGLSAMKTGRS